MTDSNASYIASNERTTPKVYTVEVTNQKRLLLLTVIFFSVFFLVFGIGFYYPDARKLGLLVIGLALLFFIIPIFKKDILSEQKDLELFDDKLVIPGVDQLTINFAEIKDYKISYYRQTLIKIELNDGEKIEIRANGNFTPVATLTKFAEDLDSKLLKLIDAGDLQAHRKSFFVDSGWFLGFIILTTGFMIYAGIAGYIKWHHLPPLYLLAYPIMGVSSIIALIARRRRKKGI